MLHRFYTFLICVLLCSCVSKQTDLSQSSKLRVVDFDREGAAKARLNLALSYLNQKKYSQAKLNLDKALNFAPHLVDVHSSRAYYFQKLGDFSLADEHYRKAFELAPNNPDVQHNYGSFLCKTGQFQQAKNLIIAAINSPNYAHASRSYANLAYCNIESGHFFNALHYLVLAHKYEPSTGEFLLMIAGLNYGLANYSQALIDYKSYLQHDELSSRALMLGVLIYRELDVELELEQTKAKLIEFFPNSQEAIQLKRNLMSQTEFGLLRVRIEQAISLKSKRSEQS